MKTQFGILTYRPFVKQVRHQYAPALAVEDVRLRGKSLTESMVSSAEAAKEEDMERL